MAQEKITIKFDAKGDDKLINSLNKLWLAQVRLEKGTKSYDRELKKLSTSQHLVSQRMSANNQSGKALQATFATLRNKLLLLSFAMAMAVKPLLDLVNAFSRAEEIGNKFNVVFGKQADIVREWAKALGDNVGRASHELEGMLSTLQDTFVPLGFARTEATKLSTSLVTLSLDVASFNNKLDEEVIRDFQSALVGNHETVRKYGIVITEATLKQEAMRSGIIKTDRELTNQEKVQARLNIIYASSKDAVGDLERTQDSYANTLKRFNAQLETTKVQLGETLLPVATALLQIGEHFADKATIKGYATAVGLVGTAFIALRIHALGAAVAINTVKVAAAKTGIALLVIGLGELATRLIYSKEQVDANSQSFEDLNFLIEEARNNYVELGEAMEGAFSPQVQAAIDRTNEWIASQKFLKDNEKTILQARIQIWSKGMSAISNIIGVNSRNAKLAANVQALASFVDAFAMASKASEQAAKHPLTIINPGYPGIVYGISLAKGLANAAATKAAADKMETGGLIGGRRHSQGGTMIEAEQGEFVMSRNAVDSVGIENLNRMNQGGGGSAVTVNVSGNVMSQDFVENELAEAIRDAARRGTDFGVS